MKEKKLQFSEKGVEEMHEMLDACFGAYQYAIRAFKTNSKELAFKVIENETKADELEIKLRSKHIKRLATQQCDTETGIIFLDVLVALERISDHARNIAEEILSHS